MSSHADDSDAVADVGLLTPVAAGTVGERLTSDRAVVDAMVRFESALLRALVQHGIAPAAASAVADAIAATDVDPRTLALAAPDGGAPVIPLIERLRADVPDEVLPWIHFDVTTQDVVDTALMLVTQDVLRQVESDLGRLAATLADQVRAGRDVPLVARTLMQHAMPTTLGMRIAGWLSGVHDAVNAIRLAPTPPVSLGGPVGTTAAYGAEGPDVVAAVAAELDLAVPVMSWHTRRTPIADIVQTLLGAGAAGGTIAADVLLMAQSEIGEVREAEGGPSSAMSHKANPTQSVLVASAARGMPPLASVIEAAAIAEAERPAGAWHAEWQPLRWLLRLGSAVAERTADLAPGLRFDEAAMARNLDQLVASVGADASWVATQIDATRPWIERVLARHETMYP
jgi:3-carboxy-cis,cis-muconate cycloisomerase